ncbi:MAG: peptide chain release factor N(5)-glutamine methyltransferase [Sphingobacteriaceae bacterium]|nr:peptide chain release factor N(5)-glutamine methyltransferase [Sphingobacteriaceae bacterium]
MRVAGNKVSQVLEYYHNELDHLYGANEVDALFKEAAEHFLKINRSVLNSKLADYLNQSDLLKIYDCAKELAKGKPIQYITGLSFFYGNSFIVNSSVLIPRPETEELVHKIIQDNKSAQSVLDIGTGSGCIPVTLKKNIAEAKIFACDVSVDALATAKKNAVLNSVEVNYFQANILNSIEFKAMFKDKVDIIVSNPPYINQREISTMHKNVLEFEPHVALFVDGDDDIIFYKSIIDLCLNNLNNEGKLYFELNDLTAKRVEEYAKKSDIFNSVELFKDMSGKWRFLKAVKK